MIKKAISIENEIEKLLNHQNLSVLIISFSTFRGDNKIRAGIMNVEKKIGKSPKTIAVKLELAPLHPPTHTFGHNPGCVIPIWLIRNDINCFQVFT